MKKIFNFGKIDFYGTGRRINLVEVEVELSDKGVFTASGRIWNSKKTDYVCGGQCLDTIAKYVKHPTFKKIYRLWEQYHLNDMHTGTEAQEEALNAVGLTGYASNYKKCCEYLESIDLLVDDGYKFGTGWLKREIPAEDLESIKSLLSDKPVSALTDYKIQNIDTYNEVFVKEI